MHRLARPSATLLALACLAAAPMIVGCETDPARQRSNKALGTVTDTRAEAVAGRREVDAVVARLGELEARPAKLPPVFDAFKSDVAAIRRRAEVVQARVQDMRLRSQQYSDAWAADAQQITSPELRDVAEARNQRVSAEYERIDAAAQELRAAYDPFIRQLDDTQTFLANDLTYTGVATASSTVFKTVRSSAAELNAKIDAFVAQLDKSKARLSPTTAPVQ